MDDKRSEEYQFLKEETKRFSEERRTFLRRIRNTLICAVIFGAAAALVFCLLRPVFTALISKPNAEMILLSDVGEEALSAESEGSQGESLQASAEKQELDLSDYQSLRVKLYNIGTTASRSVVSVVGVVDATDWFDLAYQSEGAGAGVIIADTSQYYMIATEMQWVKDASRIRTVFFNDDSAEAELLSYDGVTDIALLRVEKSALETSTLDSVPSLEIGNSASLRQGSTVIAVGSPSGEAFSVLLGSISSTGEEISLADANYQLLSTDISVSSSGNGVLINMDGQIVGMILQKYGNQNQTGTIHAVKINDLKALLEKLLNSSPPSYLGLEISTVTDSIADEYQLPTGVYIKNVAEDSPAMSAGLQVGDVIVRMNDEIIGSADQYEAFLLGTKAGDEISVTVRRMGADGEYAAISCRAVLESTSR